MYFEKKIIFKFWNVYFFSLVAFYQMCYGGTFWTQINPNDFNFSHRAYQHATSVSGVLSISLCKWITSKSINIGLDWFHWIKIIFFNRMQLHGKFSCTCKTQLYLLWLYRLWVANTARLYNGFLLSLYPTYMYMSVKLV